MLLAQPGLIKVVAEGKNHSMLGTREKEEAVPSCPSLITLASVS